MVNRNINNLPRWQNVVFGLSEILDGLVSVLTLGQFCSSFSMSTISYFTRKAIQNRKAQQLRTSL